MKLYKRGKVYWIRGQFKGRMIHKSTRTEEYDLAKRIKAEYEGRLVRGLHGLETESHALPFDAAARAWLRDRSHLVQKTQDSYQWSIQQLSAVFGRKLLLEITWAELKDYQRRRAAQGLGPRSINMETFVLCSMLREAGHWERFVGNRKGSRIYLKLPPSIGRAITAKEEAAILNQAKLSRRKALYTITVLMLNTGFRPKDVGELKWKQIDQFAKVITVGQSKTAAGTGRRVPINSNLEEVLLRWRANFTNPEPEHYVFPKEQYRSMDPTRPAGSWKVAWRNVLKAAGVKCRPYDLRHTAATRMLEEGVPLSIVAAVMGWSPSTVYQMAQRYGHIGDAARKEAVTALERNESDREETVQKLTSPLSKVDRPNVSH